MIICHMSLENGSSIQVHPFWCLCGQCFTTRPNLLRRHNGPGSVPGGRVSLSRELRMDTKCSFNSGRRTGDNWAAPSPLPRMKRFREYLWTTFGCNSAQSVLTERVLLGTDPVQVAEKQKARKPPPSGLATSHVIIGVRIALLVLNKRRFCPTVVKLNCRKSVLTINWDGRGLLVLWARRFCCLSGLLSLAHILACAPLVAGHFWHIATGRMVGFAPAHMAWIRLHLRLQNRHVWRSHSGASGRNFSILSILSNLSNWSKHTTGLWVLCWIHCLCVIALAWEQSSSRALGAVSVRKQWDVCAFCFGVFMMLIDWT